MSKQDAIAREKEERETGVAADQVVSLFSDHYKLSLRSMSREHAAANAHDAVQRHLESAQEAGGEAMP